MHLLHSDRMENLEYPFKESWVFAAALIALFSITFAVLVLSGEQPVVASFYSFTFVIHPLLLYFLFVFCLTTIMLILKVHLYSLSKEEPKGFIVADEEKETKRHWKWSLIILLGLTIAALFVPLLLLNFLDPLWWFISISGFVPGVTIPEIILFLYCGRRGKKVMKK